MRRFVEEHRELKETLVNCEAYFLKAVQELDEQRQWKQSLLQKSDVKKKENTTSLFQMVQSWNMAAL